MRGEEPPAMPARGWTFNGRAFILFAGSCAILIASHLLPRGAPWLPKCLWKTWTGHNCPFCGSTRAFQSMAHGEWRQALADNPLGAVLFLALVGAAAWNLFQSMPRTAVADRSTGKNRSAGAACTGSRTGPEQPSVRSDPNGQQLS